MVSTYSFTPSSGEGEGEGEAGEGDGLGKYAFGWSQLGSDIDGEEGSFSGYSVCLNGDGTLLAIGSPYYRNNKGRVIVYQYDMLKKLGIN